MTFIYSQLDAAHIELRKNPLPEWKGVFVCWKRNRDMGAVTVIVIGFVFSVDQIPKSNDAVFGQNEISDRRNARIQKGDREPVLLFGPFGCKDPFP